MAIFGTTHGCCVVPTSVYREDARNMDVLKAARRGFACRGVVALLAAVGLLATAAPTSAQVVDPAFAGSYSFIDLGGPAGVPTNLGGLTLRSGDPNTLLIGGNANGGNGAIYSIGVVRGAGNHITGFTGTASLFSTAPEIDGGLAYGPGGVLFYTGYSENLLGQIEPGSTSPDKIINLTPLGVASSVGSLNFVPAGFPGAGELRIVSYNGGGFYTATLTPDGTGTYDISNVALAATLQGGPEGFVYVPTGSPVFTTPSMLISEYIAGRISAYDLDVNGIPIPATRRDFITGLTDAEGAFLDPLTGDFLFSTFGSGNSRVIAVRGFAAPQQAGVIPEPGTLALLAMAAIPGGLVLRRRRRQP